MANEEALGARWCALRTVFGKARQRANKVSYLARKNKRAKALYGTGVLPAATYGAEAVGYSPSMTKQLRTMAADCMGSAKYGRCTITAIAIAKGQNGTHMCEARPT